jgi:hypothetical protein
MLSSNWAVHYTCQFSKEDRQGEEGWQHHALFRQSYWWGCLRDRGFVAFEEHSHETKVFFAANCPDRNLLLCWLLLGAVFYVNGKRFEYFQFQIIQCKPLLLHTPFSCSPFIRNLCRLERTPITLFEEHELLSPQHSHLFSLNDSKVNDSCSPTGSV